MSKAFTLFVVVIMTGASAASTGELIASPLAATTVTATLQARYAHSMCDVFDVPIARWSCRLAKWVAETVLLNWVVYPMLAPPPQTVATVPLEELVPDEFINFDGMCLPRQDFWSHNGTEERAAKEDAWKRKANATNQQRHQPGTCGPFGAGAIPWWQAIAFPSAPKLPNLSPFDNETAANFDCAARVLAVLHLVPDAITLGFGVLGSLVGLHVLLGAGYVVAWTLHLLIAMVNVSVVTLVFGISALFGFHGRLEFAWGLWLSFGIGLELFVVGSAVFLILGTPIQALVWWWTNKPEATQRKYEKRLQWSVRFWKVVFHRWKLMSLWIVWMSIAGFVQLFKLVRHLLPKIVCLPLLFFRGVTGGVPDDGCPGCKRLEKRLALLERKEKDRVSATKTAKSAPEDGTDDSDSDASVDSRASTARSAVKRALSSSSEKLKCHACGDYGHRKKECPAAKKGGGNKKEAEALKKKGRNTKSKVKGGGVSSVLWDFAEGLRAFL